MPTGGTKTHVANDVLPKLFRSSTPRDIQKSKTSDDEADCHIAKQRRKDDVSMLASVRRTSAIRAQLAINAVSVVTLYRAIVQRKQLSRREARKRLCSG